MKNILVLCTGNSCRSQMAEGYIKNFAGTRANVFSAGLETHGVNPKAIAVMKEDGIDISSHTSNSISEYLNKPFDIVITVCDNARENCPNFPGNLTKLHKDFPDPAKATGSDEEVITQFRKVRDQIKKFSKEFVDEYL